MVLAVASGAVVASPVAVSVVFLSPSPQEANNKVIAVNKIRPVKGINLFIFCFVFWLRISRAGCRLKGYELLNIVIFMEQVFSCPGVSFGTSLEISFPISCWSPDQQEMMNRIFRILSIG